MHNIENIKSAAIQTEVFWGEIAPCEHLVQIYQDDGVFLDSLEGFVSGGIMAGDGVVVIATAPHILALENRLTSRGIDVGTAVATNQYICLDAEKTLSHFMIGGWPDEILFERFVRSLLEQAKGEGRRVRAFGEMVALLWAQGNGGATVRLEHLWHRLCRDLSFSLFCAYPKSGFTSDASDSIKEICDTHSRVVA